MHPSLNVAELVSRAKDGRLTAREADEIAAALRRGTGDDAYHLLYALVRAGATDHESLVAGFLEHPAEPELSALALSGLCLHWRLAGQYRDPLLAALAGLPWDVDDDVRQAATSAAGEYLRSARDPAVLTALIEIATTEADELAGRFAAEALARALGAEHAAAVPPAGGDAGRAWTADVLRRATERAAAEGAAGNGAGVDGAGIDGSRSAG